MVASTWMYRVSKPLNVTSHMDRSNIAGTPVPRVEYRYFFNFSSKISAYRIWAQRQPWCLLYAE